MVSQLEAGWGPQGWLWADRRIISGTRLGECWYSVLGTQVPLKDSSGCLSRVKDRV